MKYAILVKLCDYGINLKTVFTSFIRNFKSMDWYSFKKSVKIYNEKETHPYSKGLNSNFFSSISFESTEIEYLDLLHALVSSSKPKLILETGTNVGISAIALAFALQNNHKNGGYNGHLITIDNDKKAQNKALKLADDLGLINYITFIENNSLNFINSYRINTQYDFIFFDSTRKVRHDEYYALHNKGLIKKGALLIFHDTCTCPVKSEVNDIVIQNKYLYELGKIENMCNGTLKFPMSRGLTVIQY